jgi:hypothetical protein
MRRARELAACGARAYDGLTTRAQLSSAAPAGWQPMACGSTVAWKEAMSFRATLGRTAIYVSAFPRCGFRAPGPNFLRMAPAAGWPIVVAEGGSEAEARESGPLAGFRESSVNAW